jgi:hypothetical protein
MKAPVTTDHDHTPCPHFEKSILATAPFLRHGVDRAFAALAPRSGAMGDSVKGMHALTRCRLPWQGNPR